MAKDFTEPPIGTPFFEDTEQGILSSAWAEWINAMARELNDAIDSIDLKLDASEFTQVVSGADASNVDNAQATAGVDTIDMAALNTALSTQNTQINAIVTVINNIWNKLEEGKFTRKNL